MKNNTLVVCGGTGAHVALALVRLHALGHPLGFFRAKNGAPLALPTIYLVDQDSENYKNTDEETAWQRVRKLVASHDSPGALELKTVTPLPVGPDQDWFKPPYDTFGKRFEDSRYLPLLMSNRHRDIQFSLGMMGSPAVGSLLFRLKDADTKSGVADGINNDDRYHELLNRRGRVAVVGSAIGGTGASVAPTLAERLASDNRPVMAVMVTKWFQFETEGLDDHTQDRAQRRERDMEQNGDSAFAYYGHKLASKVPVVPVGSENLATRPWEGDVGQPVEEHFLHGVAALCCLRHFLAPKDYAPGLYQMGAEDSGKLGGGNALPGGAGKDSLQGLANQATTLAEVLEVFADTLSADVGGGQFQVEAAIREKVGQHADPGGVGRELRKLLEDYNGHIDWMKKTLGVEIQFPSPGRKGKFVLESRSRRRLAGPDRLQMNDAVATEKSVALALMQWLAEWVGEDTSIVSPEPEKVSRGGYWPPLVGDDVPNFVAKKGPGNLEEVPDVNVEKTIQGFFQEKNVSINGWPDPMAAADHFRYAIEHGHAVACRQLKMLLAGVVMEKLILRALPPSENPPLLSLDYLVDTCRKDELPELASVQIVRKQQNGEVVLGFNSPHTLLCPTPIEDDPKLEDAWGGLWKELTDSGRPHNWRAERLDDWSRAATALGKIRAWIERQKHSLDGAAPPWTHVFEDNSAPKPEMFGRGRKLKTYWPRGAKRPISIALPTVTVRSEPDEETRWVGEGDLMDSVTALASLTTSAGVTYRQFEFTLPDEEKPVRAFWREHLEELQRRGILLGFNDKASERTLTVESADRRAALFEKTVLLDRDAVMIRECSPVRQEPVPGSKRKPGSIRYPDYPLRSRYFGILETDEGKRVVDLLKNGDHVDAEPPAVDETPAGAKAIWWLRVAGRSDLLSITLSVPREEDNSNKAHWMVWPHFRSKESPHWRAYYVYHYSNNAQLRLNTLWLDPDSDRIRQCEAPDTRGAYPVRFRTDPERRHTGGPPVAVILNNEKSDRELGLYVLNLRTLAKGQEAEVGIDFGTSHTVAAVRFDEKERLVELAPELAKPERDASLVLHVNECWSHVTDPEEGVKWLGTWLPTYTDEIQIGERKGLLPSELLTIKRLETFRASGPSGWQPGRDCVIPFMDMHREDLAKHLLFDFKWKASDFRGHESVLREIYLGMAMELVMADVVSRMRTFPGFVDLTFTYPLRDSSSEVRDFEKTLRSVVKSSTHSLGSEFRLKNEIGIYNESAAARVGSDKFGEVCLVGDLGGGTLDLFISAWGSGIEFDEVAESVKLGGNELLRIMAEHADRFLPEEWNNDPDAAEPLLRAWMRSIGSKLLLGDGYGAANRPSGLGVPGFDTPRDARETRALIERYFHLVVEYMARSLTAYLVQHWYPTMSKHNADHRKLHVDVALRGNGWRLWPDTASYAEITRKIAMDVEVRTRKLWEDRTGDRDPWEGRTPVSVAPRCFPETGFDANPKAVPILQAIGKAQRPEDIKTFVQALVQLEIQRQSTMSENDAPARIRWFDRLPAHVGGNDARVEFHKIEPPFLLHPGSIPCPEFDDIETYRKKKINERIRILGITSEAKFKAPFAPLVWENVFHSERFLKGE